MALRHRQAVTCTEEMYLWPPPPPDPPIYRVALVAGSRTVRTNMNVDTYPVYAGIDDESFEIGPLGMPTLMRQLAVEMNTYMGMVQYARAV